MENSRSVAEHDRLRRGIPSPTPAAAFCTTQPLRAARRSPRRRGGRPSLSREPAPNLVARLGPGHAGTARDRRSCAPLDLLNPLLVAAALTWRVRFERGEQFRYDSGTLVGGQPEHLVQQSVGGTSHVPHSTPPYAIREAARRRRLDDVLLNHHFSASCGGCGQVNSDPSRLWHSGPLAVPPPLRSPPIYLNTLLCHDPDTWRALAGLPDKPA